MRLSSWRLRALVAFVALTLVVTGVVAFRSDGDEAQL